MIDGYKVIEIPTITDQRGSLSFVEHEQILEFIVKRVYWLYDFKQNRGGHAHKDLKQFIFCVHGLVEFVLDDGTNKESVILNSANKGLYITKSLWRELINFTDDPKIIVLASDIYKEEDYIRSYEEFKKWKSNF
jgi:dTDP-4-dehydrorhamnose 3,5-epimerase-like enzyme